VYTKQHSFRWRAKLASVMRSAVFNDRRCSDPRAIESPQLHGSALIERCSLSLRVDCRSL
jgi:hypothetical protein